MRNLFWDLTFRGGVLYFTLLWSEFLQLASIISGLWELPSVFRIQAWASGWSRILLLLRFGSSYFLFPGRILLTSIFLPSIEYLTLCLMYSDEFYINPQLNHQLSYYFHIKLMKSPRWEVDGIHLLFDYGAFLITVLLYCWWLFSCFWPRQDLCMIF